MKKRADQRIEIIDTICVGCDLPTQVNDLGLCSDCYNKLERDLIRGRDWDYSALAFGLSDTDRERLRLSVISAYGAGYELIVPPGRSRAKEATISKTVTLHDPSASPHLARASGTYGQEDILRALEQILASTQDYVWRDLTEVAQLLHRQFAAFNPKQFGYKNLLRLIQDHPKRFHTHRDLPRHKPGSRVYVRLAKDHTRPKLDS